MSGLSKPLVVIISLPRSGATLLSQVLASCTDIGYISNRMAEYWNNPLEGLCKDKVFHNPKFFSNFKSCYGNTEGLDEPHEWGWFWSKQTNKEIVRGLKELLERSDKPLLINSTYAMDKVKLLEKSGIPILKAYIGRNPFYVVNSIVNARIERYGDINHWYGHKPKDYNEIRKVKPPVLQIVKQVESLRKQLKSYSFGYPKSCLQSNPRQVVKKFVYFLNKKGYDITIKKKNFRRLKPFPNRNDPRLINKEYKDDINTFCRLAGF